MAHRSFGQDKPEDATKAIDPITFDLADETDLACRAKVNGKLLIELVGKVDSGNVALQSEGILQVFEICVQTGDGDDPDAYTGKVRHTAADFRELDEENAQIREENEDLDEDEEPTPEVMPGVDPTSSLGRLKMMLDDPDTAITVDELAELVGWLVEQYTGRPTVNAAISRGGVSSMRPTSRRARRSQARATEKETRRLSSISSTESS